MKKLEMIKYINDNIDWFERMKEGLGNSSWWYTNRTPEDCINVKLYAGVSADDLIDELTDKEKEIVRLTSFNVEEWLGGYIWGYYGLVSDERDILENDLKENFNVDRCEYGGKSGGWLAVVYSWDYIPDDYDDQRYAYSEIKEFYQIIKNAIKENQLVIAFVKNAHKKLETYLDNKETYLDELRFRLNERLETKLDEARELLKITK